SYASGNVAGNVAFPVLATGTWASSGVFSSAAYQTVFTDSSASWTPGAMTGKLLNPKTSQARWFWIESNTATTLTIAGDAGATSSLGTTAGAACKIIDFHLGNGSPAIDRGSASVSGLPATDIDGEPRP